MMSIAPRSVPTRKRVTTLLPPSDEEKTLTMENKGNGSLQKQQPQRPTATPRRHVSPNQVVTTEFLDITGMSSDPTTASTTTTMGQHREQKRLSSGSAGLCRTKTLLSFTDASSSASSTTTSSESLDTLQGSWEMTEKECADAFGCDTRSLAKEGPVFNKNMREAMEPHLQHARLQRDRMRYRNGIEAHDSIASSVGVPYTDLRKERRFLFDEYTHPLHTILADTLGVDDLSRLHEQHVNDATLLAPLLNRHKRLHFQECYDSFVTTFCIPLLHSLAMKEQLFHSMSMSNTRGSSKITYRYQAFPCIRILRPGDCFMGPQCDMALGHSVGYLSFHIPITPAFGTNALYAESHPGREDWHPFTAKAYGLGYLFDGARCLHFNFENTTSATSVWLDFRIAIYNDNLIYNPWDGSGLCTRDILEDVFSRAGPGYYDEAVIDLAASSSPVFHISAVAAKKRGAGLLDPDGRVGVPFCG